MIYMAPCIMLLMRAASITWARRRVLGLGNPDFLGPLKWHRANRQVPYGAQKSPKSLHQKHYAQGRINYRCIGGCIYKSPWGGFRYLPFLIPLASEGTDAVNVRLRFKGKVSREYQSVCPFGGIGSPHPRPASECGRATLACRWGAGGPSSDDWKESLALCILCVSSLGLWVSFKDRLLVSKKIFWNFWFF
jgi:hypothetical protein